MDKYNLSYTLSDKELYMGLRAAKSVPAKGIAQWIRGLLLVLVMAIVGYNMTIDDKYMKMGMFLIPICLILLVVVIIVPNKAFKQAAAASQEARNVTLSLEPGLLRINNSTDILLDGSSEIEDCKKQRTFLVHPVGFADYVYIIPYRVIDLDEFEAFKGMLMTHTQYKAAEDTAADTE